MIYPFTMSVLTVLAILLTIIGAEPSDDKIALLPGYPADFQNRVFSGYLNTQSDSRKLHYVFIEGNKGVNNTSPVLIWMNGGPGCISKIGLVQEISPYCLNDSQQYKPGDSLDFNPYGWSNLTNLLFIDSPAGVGFSINRDQNYVYNDANTAMDNIFALKNFFSNKFPEYANNTVLLAGESYAGKYIPDLAIRILQSNINNSVPIRLKGLLIGNPLLNLQGLHENKVEWMISHNLIDPQLIPYWGRSCKKDIDSAGCQFFYERYQDLVYRIDQYNIYGECYGRKGPRQRALMSDLSLKMSPFYLKSKQFANSQNLKGDQWCSYDDGIENYLNVNSKIFNSQKSEKISVCNMTIYGLYKADPRGSMSQIPAILQKGIKIYLFSGDWDDVVPFTDTYLNLNMMGLRLQSAIVPWIIGDQHAGFIRNYSYGLTVYQVKGAGHEVPLYQRERAFRMFQKFVYAAV